MRFIAIFAACALAACASLPRSGPTTDEIEAEVAEAEGLALAPFALIEVTPAVAERLRGGGRETALRGWIDEAPLLGQPLAPGDSVQVTLFEATGGGLLAGGSLGEGGAARALPAQSVDPGGRILVPYAGAVAVAGLEPAEAARRIEQALEGQAIEPRALVAVLNAPTRAATVLGDAVAEGARVPLSGAGDRLLDVIAAAGGFSRALHETTVRLTRGDRSSEVGADALLQGAARNVAVHPGDVVAVLHRPRSFVMMGAVGTPAEMRFDQAEVSLAEAIGRGRGLLDDRADPRAVYLIRFEDRDALTTVAEVAQVDLARLPQERPPAVYRLDLTRPTAILSSQRIAMRDGDVVFVADSAITPTEKVLRIVGLSLPSVGTGLLAVNTLGD